MPAALSFSLIFADIHTSHPVFRTDRFPLSQNPWIMHVRNSRLSNLCCGNAASRIRALHLVEKSISQERVRVFSPRSIMLRDVWREREVNKSRFYRKFHVTLHHENVITLEFNENVALSNVQSNNNLLFIYIFKFKFVTSKLEKLLLFIIHRKKDAYITDLSVQISKSTKFKVVRTFR